MLEKFGICLIVVFSILQTVPQIIHCHSSSDAPTTELTTATAELTEYFIIPVTEIQHYCLKIFKINDNSSACLVPYSKKFEEAYAYCSENKMKLLVVHSESEMRILINVAKEFFGSGGGTVIWIDGKWMYGVNEYRLYQTNGSFHFSKKIATPLSRFSGNDDYCLTVQSYFESQYELAPIRCENKCYFFCEIL